jgi:hypothetical protein
VTGLPTPDPTYTPERVVSIQVETLATNDDPGIGVAYNFASPANRKATGLFDRFRRMVHNPRYALMIDHVEATTGPIERDGGDAT